MCPPHLLCLGVLATGFGRVRGPLCWLTAPSTQLGAPENRHHVGLAVRPRLTPPLSGDSSHRSHVPVPPLSVRRQVPPGPDSPEPFPRLSGDGSHYGPVPCHVVRRPRRIKGLWGGCLGWRGYETGVGGGGDANVRTGKVGQDGLRCGWRCGLQLPGPAPRGYRWRKSEPYSEQR